MGANLGQLFTKAKISAEDIKAKEVVRFHELKLMEQSDDLATAIVGILGLVAAFVSGNPIARNMEGFKRMNYMDVCNLSCRDIPASPSVIHYNSRL